MDGVSFSMVTEPFNRFMDDRQIRMRRAAMYTLRAAGRVVAKEAKARAPVLASGQAQSVRAYKAGKGVGAGPVAGLLRSSIKPSRSLKVTGVGGWQLTIGPRGQRVHLYSKKEELRSGYMAGAFQAVQTQMPAIAEAVYERVWRE